MDYSVPEESLGDPLVGVLANQITYQPTALHVWSYSLSSPSQFIALYAMAPFSLRGVSHSPSNWPRVLHVALAKLAFFSSVLN